MSTAGLTLDERLALHRAALSPAELRVATFMRQHPEEVGFLSVTALASRLETSDATVIRTAQALGYAGIPDLRRDLVERLRATLTPALRLSRSLERVGADPEELLDNALEAQLQLLQQERRVLNPASFAKAVQLMTGAERILSFGTGVAG